MVCAYVYGLIGVLTTPGQDGMRFALFLINLAVFKDLYRKQVFRATVRPWCHLILRQQTWQEKLNSVVVVDGLRMWESRERFPSLALQASSAGQLNCSGHFDPWRPVSFVLREHRPRHTCQLIGQCDDGDVVMRSCCQLCQPCS
jgi:hypothetical protein